MAAIVRTHAAGCILAAVGTVMPAEGQTAFPGGGKPASRPGIEIKLTCQNLSNESSYRRSYSGADLAWQAEMPAGTWALPDVKGRQVLYTMIRIGNKQRLAVLDRAPASDATMDNVMSGFEDAAPQNAAFFNRLYFDSNGNGNLQDDPALTGQVQDTFGDMNVAFFSPVEAKVSDKDSSLLYRFSVQIASRVKSTPGTAVAKLARNLSCRLVPLCVRAGEFELDGKKLCVELEDCNGNGSFRDLFTDAIKLGPVSEGGGANALRLSDFIVIGTNTYQAEVDSTERTLTLSAPEAELHALKLSSKADVLRLSVENKQSSVAMFRPGSQVSVPAGRFKLEGYSFSRDDAGGDRWTIHGAGGAAAVVEVVPGRTAELVFGEPLASTPALGGDTERLKLGIRTAGAGKEDIQQVTRLPAAQVRLPPARQNPDTVAPAFKIYNGKGDVVGKGKYEFG